MRRRRPCTPVGVAILRNNESGSTQTATWHFSIVARARWPLLAERELIPQALPGLQRKASTRLATIHRGRPIFRGISRYLTTPKPPLSVCCALFASDMARLSSSNYASCSPNFIVQFVIENNSTVHILTFIYQDNFL